MRTPIMSQLVEVTRLKDSSAKTYAYYQVGEPVQCILSTSQYTRSTTSDDILFKGKLLLQQLHMNHHITGIYITGKIFNKGR